MSLIRVTCQACGSAFKAQARFAGKVGTCPNEFCGEKIRIPLESHRTPAPQLPPRRANQAQARRQQPRRTSRRPILIGAAAVAAAMILLLAGGFGLTGRQEPSAAVADTPPADPAPVVAVQPKSKGPPPDESFATVARPFLANYCTDCHGNDYAEAEFNLQKFVTEQEAIADRATWEKVLAMLDIGAMPPEGHEPRPSMDEVKAFTAWIDRRVYYVDCSLPPDPGRVTIRRLNRNEYDNTIRDLVGLDLDLADDFPSDDVGYGFDNIGDVLSLPPLLMEKYLDAAEEIAAEAIDAEPTRGRLVRRSGRDLKGEGSADRRDGHWSMPSSGAVWAEIEFPRTGDYVLRVEAQADQAGDEKAKIEFRIDGKPVHVAEIHSEDTPERLEFKLKVEKGSRKFAAAFINDYYNEKAKDSGERDRNASVAWLEVQGPAGFDFDALPESHREIVFTRPNEGEPPARAAREVLKRFATRAWRRPVVDEELDPLVGLAEMAVAQGDTFERGMQVAVSAVLVSPHFLFRIENHPDPNDPEVAKKIGSYELATRLSYFLWSSMPDEQLFTLAELQQLHKPDVLEAQIRRMIADEKADAFVRNFGGQWLNLRLLDESFPHRRRFPDFDNGLKRDMRRETELVFAEIMRQDRSILDLLDAEFTFVNEDLAEHYGMKGVDGREFRKVSLEGTHRAGVLTHASILTLTSDPTRTSPVKRGKWILENILGTPPPPPPPNVPELEEVRRDGPKRTLREQMQVHRTNAVCASCHKIMDPLGLSFEHFDAIGRWREKDGDLTIDASGALPTGETFNGSDELIPILKERKEQFGRHFARQMLTYALGRGLEHYDKCTVDGLTAALAREDYRFSSLVIAIVNSEPFLKRRGEGETP